MDKSQHRMKQFCVEEELSNNELQKTIVKRLMPSKKKHKS
jgi:hypothetical protein